MATRVILAAASAAVLVLAAAACDKKSDSSAGAGGATPDPDSHVVKIDYSNKPPGKGTHPVTQKAVKGGTGSTRPSANSVRMDEASTDRQMRKLASVDVVDCKTLPDNSAECDGNNLYFCDDQKLWNVDCDAEAKFGGMKSGSCFEGEKFTNCLGCATADDATNVCCDFEMTVCCSDSGDCWSPK